MRQTRAEISWGHSSDSTGGLEGLEGFFVSKGAELKEPDGENTEAEEANEFAVDERDAREEGAAESMPGDEMRDDDDGRDGEDASEGDDTKGNAESRWFEDSIQKGNELGEDAGARDEDAAGEDKLGR